MDVVIPLAKSTNQMESCTEGSVTDSRDESVSSPPALPVKQRRSLYSQSSSSWCSSELEPAGEISSPFMFQSQTSSPSTESPTPTDCHEPLCPLHSAHFEISCSHSVRFFSDSNPPPLPKKRLTRALSLPGECLSVQCSHYSGYQSYENPLYMISAIRHPRIHTEPENKVVSQSPVQIHLRALHFDTPDSQLPNFLPSFQDSERVFLHIEQWHLSFLMSIVQQLETSLLKADFTKSAEGLQPTDFVLCQGSVPKEMANSTFYRVACSQLPGHVFAAKVLKSNTELSPQVSLPPHINIEAIIANYCQRPNMGKEQQVGLACQKGRENEGENIAGEGVPLSDEQSCGLSCECSSDSKRNRAPPANSVSEPGTILTLLSESNKVAIMRELPWGSLQDFVQDGEPLHRLQPEVYERRLGLLLLQVTQGMQHLLRHGAACKELRPQTVLLAWPETEGEGAGPGRTDEDRGTEEHPGGRDLVGPTDRLWRKWGTPRVILTGFQPLSHADRAALSEELQLSTLLRRCLHIPEPGSAPEPRRPPQQGLTSPYTDGLLQLATLLETGKLRAVDAPGVLQAVLWGPRTKLIGQDPEEHSRLHGWLRVKRALLIMKLAERGLSVNWRPLDWEDYLCLQYYCLTPADTLLKSATVLG